MKLYITIVCCFLFSINAKSHNIEKVEAKYAFEIVYNRDTASSIIIDARSHEMYAEKHIEGAINIDAFEDSLNTELKKYLWNKEIIVYCTNHRRAELIIEKLKELQYNGKIIFILDGINGWNSAGFKTVST